MPIPLPDLDDHSYDDLVGEALALIPALAPAWTDHNPSDPGIALVELLASLTEMLLFQVNQIPPEQTAKFLGLLNGPAPAAQSATLRDTIRGLRERYRAATPDDYEYLVSQVWPTTPAAADLGEAAVVHRVRCVPRRDLTAADPRQREQIAPAHVTVVVVPGPDIGQRYPLPAPGLIAAVWDFLDPRRILTTRHHVVGPEYRDLTVSVNLALHIDSPPVATLNAALNRLQTFLDPLVGGPAGTGWPFGRDVYLSDLYSALEAVDLVDYAEDLRIAGDRLLLNSKQEVFGLELDDHQLPRLTSVRLTGYDPAGRTYRLPATEGATG